MTLVAGTKLGFDEIQSPLGAGGMGEVYSGRDTRLDRTVAIRVLHRISPISPELKQRSRSEAGKHHAHDFWRKAAGLWFSKACHGKRRRTASTFNADDEPRFAHLGCVAAYTKRLHRWNLSIVDAVDLGRNICDDPSLRRRSLLTT
jgi:serine/threonine protein kinase